MAIKRPIRVRYPWDKWFARKRPFKLCRGVDYWCQPYSMGVQIRAAAYQRGMHVSIHIDGGTLTVEVY